MDPITILTTATAASKAIYSLSTTLYTFIQGSLTISKSLQSLVDEVSSLQNAIFCISNSIRSPALQDSRAPGRVDVADNPDLFASLESCLSKCGLQLENFEGTLRKIQGSGGNSSSATNNPFRNSLKQVRLDLNAKEIVTHRAQIVAHTSTLQLMLQMLNVHISARAPDVVIDTLSAKMDVLERMLLELDTHKSLQSDFVTSDISDDLVLENTSRLRRAARKVITSASSVVSSGSTVWGGSIAGDEPMPQHHRAQISAWNLAVCEEADEESNNGAVDAQKTNQSPKLDSNDFDTEAFALLIKEGERLDEKGMLAEAERMYQRALKLNDISSSARNDVNLRIAIIYQKLKKWEPARKLLYTVLESESDEAFIPSSAQRILTQHRLAEVCLEMDELDEAEKQCKEVMNAARRIHGREHEEYLRSVRLLVLICKAKGDVELANAFESTLTPETREVGEDQNISGEKMSDKQEMKGRGESPPTQPEQKSPLTSSEPSSPLFASGNKSPSTTIDKSSKNFRTLVKNIRGSKVQVKVRNAIDNNSPWGPPDSELSEIAQMTFNGEADLHEIMSMLEKRLAEAKAKNWKRIWKALMVLDYCLSKGSKRVATYAYKMIDIIKALRLFQYIDDDGQDVGRRIPILAKALTSTILDAEEKSNGHPTPALSLDKEKSRNEKDTSEGPLPPGWELRLTSAGRPYYVDHNTRRNSWNRPSTLDEEKPREEKGLAEPALPAGWEQRLTAQGRIYYVDHNTKKTSWKHPLVKDSDIKNKENVGDDAKEQLANLQKTISETFAQAASLYRDQANARAASTVPYETYIDEAHVPQTYTVLSYGDNVPQAGVVQYQAYMDEEVPQTYTLLAYDENVPQESTIYYQLY